MFVKCQISGIIQTSFMIKKTINEKEIIDGILKGDESSLRIFYRHFKPSLSTFIRNRVSNEKDAEEILQDTLFDTIEGLRDFGFRCRLFTFICSIANHKIIDFYRRKKIKSIIFSRSKSIEPMLMTLLGPENVLDDALLRQNIESTFRKISPTYQKILKLKYIYGYSVGEIANKLSISFKSCESHLFRARKAFAAAYII
jgi:RNA polymerase sigma-70 factor, ECF subfamily